MLRKFFCYGKSIEVWLSYVEGSTCKIGEQDQFEVSFHNRANYPIDIIWKTDTGKEKLMKSKLASGAKIVFVTYSTHRWIFKKSSSNDRLLANANGITDEFFEGCHFKANPNERIIVTISNGNLNQVLQIE